MASQPIKVALVNDYQLVVEGLATMLAPFSDRVRVVDLAADRPSRVRADVALYDTFATDSGLCPEVNALHLVLWTTRMSPEITAAALDVGADGVLPKRLSPEELVEALERVCAGEVVIGDVDADPGARQETGPVVRWV